MIKVICLSSNSDAMEKGHWLVQKLSKRYRGNCRSCGFVIVLPQTGNYRQLWFSQNRRALMLKLLQSEQGTAPLEMSHTTGFVLSLESEKGLPSRTRSCLDAVYRKLVFVRLDRTGLSFPNVLNPS